MITCRPYDHSIPARKFQSLKGDGRTVVAVYEDMEGQTRCLYFGTDKKSAYLVKQLTPRGQSGRSAVYGSPDSFGSEPAGGASGSARSESPGVTPVLGATGSGAAALGSADADGSGWGCGASLRGAGRLQRPPSPRHCQPQRSQLTSRHASQRAHTNIATL